MAAPTLATLTLFRVAPRHLPFALARLGRARRELAEVPGAGGATVRFLGSGGGPRGLSPVPALDRYGLLVPAWASADAAAAFLEGSAWMRAYRARAEEVLDLYLLPVSGHGRWDGGMPFACGGAAAETPGPLAVLTRATLRPRKLPAFQRASLGIEAELDRAGAWLAVGLGDLPWLRQATFSVWRDESAMRAFAYRSPVHREAMRRARAERWFVEDLFVRFRVVGVRGRWRGAEALTPEALAAAGPGASR